ncbi:hypothetical protein [Myxococcus sp. CA039A]|uniref:hypothetical protein n=1 Tax=Myxococcus sp. CA039A TaxID=2741737 RepID=UPI00157B3515|nr:hypothetical protein [Myxococcus sp. CA039A]NTX54627.1 hypothetical protein [Myxococcus sp. CA039A]
MTRLAVAVFLFFFTACSSPPPKEPEAAAPRAADVLGVRADFVPRYTVASTQRLDIGGTPRLMMKVVVPRGLSREELEGNVRHALLRAYELGPVRFGAIMVGAYSSEKTDTAFNAAKGDFAPGGKWSESSTDVPLSEWKAQIEFSDLYFLERTYLAAGTRTVLVLTDTEFSDTIHMSRVAARWLPEDTVAVLKPGVPVVVIGHEDVGLAGVRYEVETAKGKKHRGWVHGADLQAE